MSDEPAAGNTNSVDPLAEIDAMRGIAEALAPLTHESKTRVLLWAVDHYRVGTKMSARSQPSARAPMNNANNEPVARDEVDGHEFEELADLYSRCRPKTDAQKALVVAYWMQVVNGVKGIDSRSINNELKNLGHGVGNITRAFDGLKSHRPQLAIQTKKAGGSRQARKTYKVTVEGKAFVDRMINPAEE